MKIVVLGSIYRVYEEIANGQLMNARFVNPMWHGTPEFAHEHDAVTYVEDHGIEDANYVIHKA